MSEVIIRNAEWDDLDDIFAIYARARAFMKEAGNPTQWGDTFPPEELVRSDIELRRNYVCVIDDRIQAVFAMIDGADPTYQVIQGAWLNDEPYAAVHRVASRSEVKGITAHIFKWALEQRGNIRIDTHDDNIPMQRAIEKYGFTKCGRIWVEDGSPRIAYQKFIPKEAERE